VTIQLPAVHRVLTVLTSPDAGQSWILLQVGEQDRQRGVTFVPNGQPTPVMSLVPPSGAADADVTERIGDGLHQIHLSESDLQSGVVHLAGDSSNLFDVLIVYHDKTGATIDATGSEF
jgi:hypothetical protein